MQLRMTYDMIQNFPQSERNEFDISESEYHYTGYTTMSLDSYGVRKLGKLLTILENMPDDYKGDVELSQVQEVKTEFEDFNFKGFSCTVVKYGYHTNYARILWEGLESDFGSDWWCGYIRVLSKNKFYNKPYDDIDINCHGGLTFSGKFHVKDSNNYQKFVIGFDYAHARDMGGNKELAIEGCKKVVKQLIRKSTRQKIGDVM